jgi:5'-methylthioadenosine phosphorylase
MAIGIIGGTGMDNADFLEDSKEIKVETPYGIPSQPVMKGRIKGTDVVVILRHGKGHKINPTAVNYRANIFAMKKLGVTRILAPCAVGSLKEEIKPGDLVVLDQFIDKTTSRASTFYDKNQVCHISMAEPFCPELRKLVVVAGRKLKLPIHEKGINVVMEGPRFSTKAESHLHRSWNVDTINMTLVPECILAKEAQICYVPIAQVTDYDCWKESTVTAEVIVNTLKDNIEKTKKLLLNVIPKIPEKKGCNCEDALKHALL